MAQTMNGAQGEKIMGDKYTVYPEALRKRIQKVDKMFADDAKEKERWASLSPEQQEAEIKEAERINALPPEEQEAEIKKMEERVPLPEPTSEPTSESETVDSLKTKLEKAEQQLRTLQGKYEKEPAELQRQNNFFQEQIALLQRQISELKTQPVVKEPEKKLVFREVMKARIDKLKEQLAPEIVEEIVSFNEESFELVQKVDQERATQMITEVATKVDSRLALTAKEKFDRDLLEAYPNWEIMWKTPEFQTFLGTKPEDDLSGVDRFVHIEDAFKRYDSRTVIKAFDLFTGKKPELKRETNINQDKLKNRVVGPRTSSPGGIQTTKTTNQMSPQEARTALAALSSKYSRGLYTGSREQYDKEYAKLHALCDQKPPG